jgi:hypothetical protein
VESDDPGRLTGLFAAVKESTVIVRLGTLSAITAAGLLVAFALWRYPAAAGGGGGPFYLTVTAVVLACYAAGTVSATRRVRSRAGLRRGMRFGTVAAVVAAVLTMPFAGVLAERPAAVRVIAHLALGLAVLALAAAAAMLPSPRQAITAGIWVGAMTALTNFLLDLGMAVAAPQRLAIDPSVAARHTGSDLLAANLGEQTVIYIMGLVGWPILGAFAAALGFMLSDIRTSRRASAR